MIRALKAIGFNRAIRYILSEVVLVLHTLVLFPPFRQILLRSLGATIGKNSLLMDARFTNLDRTGLKGLIIGKNCYLGRGVKLDLADSIILEDHVTLAEESMVLTHLNVGYEDHPLQRAFPAMTASIIIGEGSFIGARAVILPGVQIGKGVFVAAGSVVNKSVEQGMIVGGVPAKIIGKVENRQLNY